MNEFYEIVLNDGNSILAITDRIDTILEIYMRAGNDDSYIWIVKENDHAFTTTYIKNSLVSYIRLPINDNIKPI